MDILLQNLHSKRKKQQVELPITKSIHWKIFKIQFLFTDRRLVKIITLHRRRKNAKMKNIAPFQN